MAEASGRSLRSGQMNRLHKWIVAFLVTALTAVVLIMWFDKPIAYFAHDEFRRYQIFDRLTQLPEPFVLLATLTLLAVSLRCLTGRPLSKGYAVAVVCSLSLIVGDALKSQLKFVFGRTWPETWVQGNPSLIRDGVYGFNPFHGGPAFASFPSGHIVAICAITSVLWICYPRFRWFYAACVAAVAIGLVGANYHFLSDIIAGGFIGASVGWMAVALWESGGNPRIS
jgi:membrane-associated phospholipid phosphatase